MFLFERPKNLQSAGGQVCGAWDTVVAKLTGQIVNVTDSGHLVTDISLKDLAAAPRDESVKIRCGEHITVGIFPLEHGQPEMTFVAFEGASGFVELALVGDDASRFLGINAGSAVTITWR